jgi:metallophosphoesterase superfamily enzyme
MKHYMKLIPLIFAGAFVAMLWVDTALALEKGRPIYVISDLHMGVGKAKGSDWHRLEDFRWPRAFEGFLRQIIKDSPDGADLVIAGDFLELWQHPTVSCAKLQDEECGCSIGEMKKIVEHVIAGHEPEFREIGHFLAGTNNWVFVIPGNHDAALMEDEIWALVVQAVPEGRERFERVRLGTWFSKDGKVAVEHGHQHTFDANWLPDWPASVTKNCSDGRRFFRPWGENFVQTIYNDKEEEIPLIDNLIPESVGISIYSQYSEMKGKKVEDIARFAIYNLLQTSPYQKIALLDVKKEQTALSEKDVKFCRCCIGEDLILQSPEGQRNNLLYGISGTEREINFRQALRQQVMVLEDDEIRDLCERVAVSSNYHLKSNPALLYESDELKSPECRTVLCEKPLATAAKKIFDPHGIHALKKRVNSLAEEKPSLLIYAFGHTHEAKIREPVPVKDGTKIIAFNTGAFQRLMDKEFLAANKKPEEKDVDLIQRMRLDDMMACYTTLVIVYDQEKTPQAQLKQWRQKEDIDSVGDLLGGCSSECSARPANCR